EGPTPIGWWRHLTVAARRQAWVLIGDQRNFVLAVLLPFVFGALCRVLPGRDGLRPADPYGDNPNQAVPILVVLTVAAVVMGLALTIRDPLAERFVLWREQSVGLSASAHLAAKLLVYTVVALIQTAVLTVVAVPGDRAPTGGGAPILELYLAVAGTAVVSAMIGLALSALANYPLQLLVMFVLVILVSLVFCGGMAPITGRPGFEQVSWLVPARWGFAAAASSVDLRTIDLLAADDILWTPGWWWFDMTILAVLGMLAVDVLWWVLRLPSPKRYLAATGHRVPAAGAAGRAVPAAADPVEVAGGEKPG
ncbi:ABC transporter permease, partial [Mycobacterium talmoniae]|uniref:ABC transporter permease n=1 Tax=Mycobacterium talmoniae TaxID=1858794 RepID=UPI0013F4D8A2